jgi:uncharacterized protein (DUF1330 family)
MTSPRRELLVGLRVADNDEYDAYRAGMRPILDAFGGTFRRDFRVTESLTEGDPGVNRVFILSFPSADAKDRFFADPAYRAVRAAHFDGSVAHADIIAEYER